MSVESLLPPPNGTPLALPVEVEVEEPEAGEAVETEDGGLEITIGGPLSLEIEIGGDHDDNLVEVLPDDVVAELASELIDAYEVDERSRADWLETLNDSLELLGLKTEERTEPWDGACGIFHPLMTEAAVRFQSQAITEIFPAAGPTKTVIMGPETPDAIALSNRIRTEMNYQLTEKMVEYRGETEAMLFRLPLAGSCFKKVQYDPVRKRARAMMVPAEHLCVNYGATSLHDVERITHISTPSMNQLKLLVAKGVYAEMPDSPGIVETSSTEDAESEATGVERPTDLDDAVTLLEIHTNMALDDPLHQDDLPKPYIVTIVKETQQVLAIRRNWKEDDADFLPRQHFVHYKYLPGFGFYGIGLIQLIGGLTRGATSVMRQLVDAGTLANLPAGFKAKGMRWKNQDTPIGPGEWRDVDIPSGTIKENLLPLPYKEPSAVLFQLLQNIVEEGRRLGSIAEVDMSQMSGEAPVGTVLAILERNLKVQTAVHSRLHAALREELKLIEHVIANDMPPSYDYPVKGDFLRADDFNNGVSILPVSDPNAATMSQRIVQHQAVMQNAAAAPDLYDMARLHRTGLEILDWPDPELLIPLQDDMKPKDPVTENMAILRREPVKAFIHQDHESHLAVHMAAIQDPKMMQMIGQSSFGPQIQAAMEAHIAEHVAYQYRRDIEKTMGVALPAEDVELPPDVEANLAYLAAEAAQRVLGKHEQEAAAQQAEAEAMDPLTQIQQRELDIKQQQVDLKKMEIESRERMKGAELGVKIATDDRSQDRSDKVEGIRLGVSIAESMRRQQIEAMRPQKPVPGNKQ